MKNISKRSKRGNSDRKCRKPDGNDKKMKKEFLGTKCCVSKNWTEIKNVNYRDETLFYFMTKKYKYLSVYTI